MGFNCTSLSHYLSPLRCKMLRVTPDGLASHPLGEGGRGEKGKGAEAKILLLLASEINLDKLRPESFLTCMQDLTRLLTTLFLHIKFGCGSI